MDKIYYIPTNDDEGPTIRIMESKQEYLDLIEEKFGQYIKHSADKLYVSLNTLGYIGTGCLYEGKADIIKSIWSFIDTIGSATDLNDITPNNWCWSGAIKVRMDSDFGLQIMHVL